MHLSKTAGGLFQAGHNTGRCMGGPDDRASYMRVSRPIKGRKGVCKVFAPEGAARTASSIRLCSPCGVTARVSASAVVTTDLSCTFTCRAASPFGVQAVHHLALELAPCCWNAKSAVPNASCMIMRL